MPKILLIYVPQNAVEIHPSPETHSELAEQSAPSGSADINVFVLIFVNFCIPSNIIIHFFIFQQFNRPNQFKNVPHTSVEIHPSPEMHSELAEQSASEDTKVFH